MVKNFKKDFKDEKMKTNERGSHDFYDKSGIVGSLGGVALYAEAQKIFNGQAKKEFEKNLVYTLHKPRCQRGEFSPWWCLTLMNNGWWILSKYRL